MYDETKPKPTNEKSVQAAPSPQQATMWVVRILLIGEVISLIFIVAAFYLNALNEQPIWDWLGRSNFVIGMITVFLVPAILLGIAGIVGLLTLRTFGWVCAMLTQTFVLLGCILYYSTSNVRPLLLYLLMLGAVNMVLYLNSVDIRTRFRGTATSHPRADL